MSGTCFSCAAEVEGAGALPPQNIYAKALPLGALVALGWLETELFE